MFLSLFFHLFQGRMKYEKVHQIYKKYLEIEDVEPTLVKELDQAWFFLIFFYYLTLLNKVVQDFVSYFYAATTGSHNN